MHMPKMKTMMIAPGKKKPAAAPAKPATEAQGASA